MKALVCPCCKGGAWALPMDGAQIVAMLCVRCDYIISPEDLQALEDEYEKEELAAQEGASE